MSQYSVAAAKDGLSSLIDKALRGEEVIITRRGQAVVEVRALTSGNPARTRREWLDHLRNQRETRPPLGISAADLVRSMREEDGED